MDLKSFLIWLVSPVGAGVLAYLLIDNVPRLCALEGKVKRWVAAAISAGIAILGFMATVGLGYQVAPIGGIAWLEAVFAVATGAFSLATIIHGVRNLK